MAIYTERIAIGSAAGPGANTVYTVPAGKMVILRSISITRTGADGNAIVAYVVPTGGAGAATIMGDGTGVLGRTYVWDGRQVINAGDELVIYSGSGGVQWIVSGYVFNVP